MLVHWLVAPGVMAGLDLTAIDKILDLWKWSQHQEAAAKKKIEKYRAQVEAFLFKAGTTGLITAKYKAQRQLQSKERISKKDVPANIWTQYAKKSLFTSLAFKRFSARKAKAKTMAARAAGVKSKAKAKGK